MKVKIVYETKDGEFEIGPFNQGVVFDHARREVSSQCVLVDVASGESIAKLNWGNWFLRTEDHAHIEKLFIQAVPTEGEAT